MKIIKRSGVEVFFDSNKIVAAVQKANASVIDYEKLSDEQIQEIADNVEVACEKVCQRGGNPGYGREPADEPACIYGCP